MVLYSGLMPFMVEAIVKFITTISPSFINLLFSNLFYM